MKPLSLRYFSMPMSKKILVLFIWLLSLPGFLGAALLPASLASWESADQIWCPLPMDSDPVEEDIPARPNLLEEEVVEGLHQLFYSSSVIALFRAFPQYFSVLKEKIPSTHALGVDEQPPNLLYCIT